MLQKSLPTSLVRAAFALLAAATLLLTVAFAEARAAAPGTLSVKLDGAPRKAKKAKRTATVRVIDLRTGGIAYSASLKKTTAKIKLQPGAYIVALRTIDIPGKAVEGTGKFAVVKSGRTTKQTLKAKPLRKAKKKKRKKKRSKKASVSAALNYNYGGVPSKYFAPASVTADRMVVGIDAAIRVKGYAQYPDGLDIDSVLTTSLSNGCPAGEPKISLVEIRRRAEIVDELNRGNDPRFDKSKVAPIGGLWRERFLIRGSGSVSGGKLTVQISMVEIATGEVVSSGLATGGELEISEVSDAAAKALLDKLCGAKVDVTFTGSGNYRRDEVSTDGDNEDHITADYTWTTVYRGVSLDVDGGLTFSESSIADGHWNTAGRFGAVGPGNYNCSASVISYNGDFAMLRVGRPGGMVRLVVDPYMSLMGDYDNKICTGLPGPPFASFHSFGFHAANQATVEFSIADLSAGPIVRAVSPTSVVAPDCADVVGGYETPCSQSSGWSGTITVTRSE